MSDARPGWVYFDSWAGVYRRRCEVIGETRTRYRVRAIEGWRKGRGRGMREVSPGDVTTVPKYAVGFKAQRHQAARAVPGEKR